ncbi:MAG: cysteine--tRNA ligase [Chlorobi bacterium]|nr:cysteine--tRNA ligase [Chlorobiota bacterium]
MKIYNTLHNKKEEFSTLEEGKVSMYVCGPTVYDYFHIGNGRTFVMTDIIRRYLEYKGYDVKYVMNLTDVDDKIIKKANEENVETSVIAERYAKAFLEDIEKLRVKRATVYPKATEHMKEMIDIVKKLEEKGIAYNAEGDVFYDVLKFNGYGKLSGKNVEDLESGARVELHEGKKNALDFSLWKKAKEGEPYWESPWGNGRPGWHLECSAMSMKHLGSTIDIHAGGNDLIFPHHENEIAQSEACCTNEFVRYWMHFGFLNINNEKMSKSLGNFFTARDILKHYSAGAVRLLFCQTHYRSPLSFSQELLDSAEKGLEKIYHLAEAIDEGLTKADENGKPGELDFSSYYSRFEDAMDDDFNTSQGAAVLFDFVKNANKLIASEENLSKEFYEKAKEFIQKTASDVFGIFDFNDLQSDGGNNLENELIQILIDLRLDAKKEKNFALADKIRDSLAGLGIMLKDGKEGTTFSKSK